MLRESGYRIQINPRLTEGRLYTLPKQTGPMKQPKNRKPGPNTKPHCSRHSNILIVFEIEFPCHNFDMHLNYDMHVIVRSPERIIYDYFSLHIIMIYV